MEIKNSRRDFLEKSIFGGTLALSGLPGLVLGKGPNKFPEKIGNQSTGKIKPDKILRSFPENMVWGYFGADVPPKLTVKEGEIVEIHSISTSGVSREDPESFFRENNLPLDDHAKELIDIIHNVPPEPSGIRGHMLTGPVFIEGAMPGDSIEIRIHDVRLRSDFGVNHVRPGSRDDVPLEITNQESFVYKYNKKRTSAELLPGVEIPLKPFMGVMALSPPSETGRVSSIPPDFFGGNLDLKHLVKGTSLTLPVSVEGGLFTTGDAHGAQGNGEVSGTAIETSMILVAEFIIHKKTIQLPVAETPDHFIVFGLNPDLDEAMKQALRQSVVFIHEKLGFTYEEAMSISSTAVDFEITQVVDRTEGVHGMIPKSIFTNHKFDYWYSS
ncbi:acetamidase/formamidase family protein [Cyclobacterium salsum]|uniref:acetamidase/formamidase family protein n=1 Tax=Cyclobacterium salsum TaxID=2666329 RepID=UPI001390F196|nr:acetamidase/formamidase family protein [Cyclobacterium salsum]